MQGSKLDLSSFLRWQYMPTVVQATSSNLLPFLENSCVLFQNNGLLMSSTVWVSKIVADNVLEEI